MTDNEIIKALGWCSEANNCCMCEYEPTEYIKGTIGCANELCKRALSLINRQKAEIERLQGCVKSEEEVRAIMKSQMMPMVKEIVNEQFDVAVKLARAEAIKEFAERLKSRVIMRSFSQQLGVVLCFGERSIDNLVKEMVGEDK